MQSKRLLFIGGRRHYLGYPDPDAFYTKCWGTNNAGAIVGGYAASNGGGGGFIYQNGFFTQVGTTPGYVATCVNDFGFIAGYYTDIYGVDHGFLYNLHGDETIDVPGAIASYVWGINNQGLMVIQWVDSSGKYHSSTSS